MSLSGGVDRRALGEALLELLEEDREFRHAVMGLLGYREVLERITRLEERFARLEERFAKLEEEFLELRRAQQRLEERQQRLEERQQKLEEHGMEERRVQRLRYVDADGRFIAPGATLEIDVYINEGDVWLVEVKSYVEADDVTWFYEKTRIAEKVPGRRPSRRIMLAVEATKAAARAAEALGVELLADKIVEEE
ncbi:hypothetical protein [Pyrodictium abyssi]|uniref:DUF3782 domain-containing protein n=1 Tax=Pyrodictium abyssi TaxID=54256 RepID=A0ABN6ZNX5_9CREN|nr:hypothetical protein PABY_15010 [Pyrodictium abyssi]